MRKIEICNRLESILNKPIGKSIDSEREQTFTYDIDLMINHVKECKFCKNSFLKFYNELDIPFFAKNLVKQLI